MSLYNVQSIKHFIKLNYYLNSETKKKLHFNLKKNIYIYPFIFDLPIYL